MILFDPELNKQRAIKKDNVRIVSNCLIDYFRDVKTPDTETCDKILKIFCEIADDYIYGEFKI